MLTRIGLLGNLPMEHALAAHLELLDEFESFSDEYSHGGYTLELKITSTAVYLSLGYEAHDCEAIHYECTPAGDPLLTLGIATHNSLHLGRHRPAPSFAVISSSRKKPIDNQKEIEH
jgi:hypothetical protein